MGWLVWIISYAITKDSGADALALNPWWITFCFFVGGIKFNAS